ncbi:MAG: flagellar export chaperone FliS [Gammaproteobacteria bacterium]
MGYKNLHGALKQYSQTAMESGIESASPHRLVQMLMEGALDKIASAKGSMARRAFEAKGHQINWAISIINGLRMSLDKDGGGELVENLDSLYDYMVRRLMSAHVENNPAMLDEVASLLREIKSAWDAIPDEIKNAPRAAPETIEREATKPAAATGR